MTDMKGTAALFLPAVLVLVSAVFILNDESCSKKKKKHKKDYNPAAQYSESDKKNTVSAFISLQLTDDETYTPEQVLNFILTLQEEESRTIHRHTGIHSATSRIEGYCRQMVARNNPNTFNEVLFMSCFEEMVKIAFPDRLEQIMLYFRNLIQYRTFLESESSVGSSKNQKERDEALWRKRHELFGVDAAEELYASEKYLKNLEQKISANTSSKKSMDEKIRFLQDEIANIRALQNQQETVGEEFIQFGEIFLSSPEVQAGLRAMSPENRYKTLRAVRQSSGVPESRLDQLEEWDRSRASLWEKGQQYLKEVSSLKEKSDLSAEEYSQEVKKLKESYFGKETADEIEEEEKRGISRFTQKPEFLLQ